MIIEIKREKVIFWLRWALVPFVMLAVFVLTYYSTEFLARRGLRRRWIEPVAYFQTCFLGSILVGFCVPRWKTLTLVAMTIPLIPAGLQIAAWFDPITQEPTVMPFTVGLAGGLIGLAIIGIREYRNRGQLKFGK